MQEKIHVGVLGATGAVGQRFVQLLANHPWFDLTVLGASERSAGKRYRDAVTWILEEPIPENVAHMELVLGAPGIPCQLVFSALPNDAARLIEPAFAAAGYGVYSNAAPHRMVEDVPLLIPEVNPHHLALLETQRAQRGWSGFIVTNPNCTATHLVSALKPIYDAFGLCKVFVVSMQALSGAGYPGVASLDILDNVIPYISNEEAKVESEPLKMLGELVDGAIRPADFAISAQCNRVAVRDGHTECVSIQLERMATADEIIEVLESFRAEPQWLNLPTAPEQPIVYLTEQNRPQPRLDRMRGNGMVTTIGRLRPCPLLNYKFVVLGHNTLRGAAGGSVLNAELMHAQGLLHKYLAERLPEAFEPITA